MQIEKLLRIIEKNSSATQEYYAKERRLKVSIQNKVPETPAQLHILYNSMLIGQSDFL